MSPDRRTVLLAVVSAAVVALAVAPGIAGAATKSDVRVVNTAAEAVPVAPQGTTQVAGTVNVGNSPTVTIGGMPTVDVKNDPGDPLFVQEVGDPGPAETPFQRAGAIIVDDGESFGLENLDVPDGKDLVVQYVTVRGFRFDAAEISSGQGTGSAAVYLPLTFQAEKSTASHEAQVLLSNALVFASRADTTGFARLEYVVNGYLIDE
jgi:hypothetical protein